MRAPPFANASLNPTGSELHSREQVVGEDHLLFGAGLRVLPGRLLVEHRGRQRGGTPGGGGRPWLRWCRPPFPPNLRRDQHDTRVRGPRMPRRILGAMAAPKSFLLTPELGDYLVAHGTPPDRVQQELIAETAGLGAGRGHAGRARAGRVPHVADPRDRRARARSRSERSRATPPCASRVVSRPTAGCCAATCPTNGRRSVAATGRRPASRIASTCASRPRSKHSPRLRPTTSSIWRSSTPTSRTTGTTSMPSSPRCAPTDSCSSTTSSGVAT